MSKDINDVLSALTDNCIENTNLFLWTFGSLEYRDKYGNSLYHMIVRSNAKINAKILAILTLIYAGVAPGVENNWGDTFLHTAIKMLMPVSTFDLILSELQKRKISFPLNAQNRDGDTLFHLGLYSLTNDQELITLTTILKKYNFDFTIANERGETCIELVNSRFGIAPDSRQEILTIISADASKKNKNTKNSPQETKSNVIKKTANIDKYGTILNEKVYDTPKAIGRDDEINKIIVSLATGDKLPILVGPSGVGKTTIIDELVYRIKNKLVPKFLTDKIVYEVHMSNILAGTKYRGGLEENLKEIFDFVINNNALLFLDEFHTAFGAGANEYDSRDAAGMIKTYIDRYNLQVIGATTGYEYEKYMAHDALKRRFEVIKVDELADKKLQNVVLYTFENLAERKGVTISNEVRDHLDEIVQILIDLTKDKNRKYDDKIYNPDLVISIINRAFAYILVNDDMELMLKHIVMGIEDSERLYPSAKEIAIKNINLLATKAKTLKREKVIEFSSYKKG